MSSPTASGDAAEFCAAEVRLHDFERYATTLFVTPEQRRALLALYAFNLEVSRVREHIRQPLAGEIRLQWWSDMLAGSGHGYVEGNPVAAELLWAIQSYDLPVARLSHLIEQHQFDLYNDPMPTREALALYLDGTAAALFALAAQILGGKSPEIEHVARHAGQAAGAAEVIATLAADASRRQLFVPVELLEASGANAEEMFAGVETPMLRATLDQFIDEATAHLEAAITELAGVVPGARRAFLQLAFTRRRLDVARRPDYEMFVPHTTSRLRVLWTLWRASRSRLFRA
jgi:phytoene synthase